MSDRIEVKALVNLDEVGDVIGVASVFDVPDLVGDVITKGAFSDAPATLPMLFGHYRDDVVGVWDSVTEGPDGLIVKGRLLVEDMPRAREVHAMVKAGALTGLSVGFNIKQAVARKGGGRIINKLDLKEVSLVSFPAQPRARVLAAKSGTSAAIAAAINKTASRIGKGN